ncbi:16S rRNA processing protein [Babesia caballi]|uniref:16S rRNA processing protein n=1 Tax=Babesia caballi TaxID=5871 RepID=A0AAV4LMY8_BABCB|nr:16S rRNA processing protein [Babesia caballi]
MPKEALVGLSGREDAPDPELIANMDKFIKSRFEKENLEATKSAEGGSSVPRKPAKTAPKPAPQKKQPEVKCPNAILLDKSIIFSTPVDEYIVVGKILSPHGLRGHVKVRSLCSNPELRLYEPGYRFLKFRNREETVMPIKIEYGRLLDGEKTYRLKLEGVDSKDQALRLNGSYLSVSIRDVPPLEEDCYYSRDLMDLDIYLFNDDTKTRLGKVVGFWHREDLVSHPKFTNLTEDLIEVEMDIRLSLQTLVSLTKKSKEIAEAEREAPPTMKPKGVSVVTDRDLDAADEVIDAEEELASAKMMGEFTNQATAMEHDRAHEAGVIPDEGEHEPAGSLQDGNHQGQRVYTLDEFYEKDIKTPVRRFYIPLIKEETIKFVDVPNKSIYVETFTVFIGEDGKKITP